MNTQRNVLTEKEAKEVFGHLTPVFLEIIQDSFNHVTDWISIENQNGFKRSLPIVNANLMHFYVLNKMFNAFEGGKYPGVKPVVFNRVFGLSYMDAAFLRVKKLDENFMPSRGHTYQADALNGQWETKIFPSEPCIITLGYICDKLWTELKSVNLLCLNSKEPLWNIHIDREAVAMLELDFPNFQENVSYSVDKLIKTKKNNMKI